MELSMIYPAQKVVQDYLFQRKLAMVPTLDRNFHDNSPYMFDNYHEVNSSCGRQKGPSMMTRYTRSYSLQKGPSLEDSLE